MVGAKYTSLTSNFLAHQRCHGANRLRPDGRLETSQQKEESFICFGFQAGVVGVKARKCLGRYGCLLNWS